MVRLICDEVNVAKSFEGSQGKEGSARCIIDPPELLHGLVNRTLNIGLIGDICSDGDALSSLSRCNVSQQEFPGGNDKKIACYRRGSLEIVLTFDPNASTTAFPFANVASS